MAYAEVSAGDEGSGCDRDRCWGVWSLEGERGSGAVWAGAQRQPQKALLRVGWQKAWAWEMCQPFPGSYIF